MDSKQSAGRLNFDVSFLESTNLLRAAYFKKRVEQLKKSLNDVQESCRKESLENATAILNLLSQSMNPYAYRVADSLINQLKELELLNRKTVLNFNDRHLSILNEQKRKISQLIDQSMSASSLFKCEAKNVKLNEDKQALCTQFDTAVIGQLEEIFRSSGDAFPVGREQIDLKIKYLTSLLPVVEQFVRQRLDLIEKQECDNLKELFRRTMKAFDEEFKRCFKTYSKMSVQFQRDQFEALKNREVVDQQQQFKASFESLKANMLAKLDELERSYNEEVKNHLSSLAKDLVYKISITLQQTCDVILEKSRQLIEANQSSHPTRSTYQQLLTELFSFKELFNSVHPAPKSGSIKRKQAEELKAKTRELFGKICAHRFKASELAKIKIKPSKRNN